MESLHNAQQAALWSLEGGAISQADFDGAAAEWIRSLIKDKDIIALTEFFAEQAPDRVLNLMAMVADALECSTPDHATRLGDYMSELAYDYIAADIDALAREAA